jgi:cytochrome b561
MQLANTTARYGTVPQVLHWLTAILVICGFLLGQFGDDLPKGNAQDIGLFVHMTLGQCVVVLLIARLVWRVANRPPPPEPTPLGRLVAWAARLSHFTLYALLLVVPFLGIIVQLKRGHALPVLGFWEFQSPWPADRNIAKTILGFHGWLADALLILAGMHAGAALVHHYVWRDLTLRRMLPGAASP